MRQGSARVRRSARLRRDLLASTVDGTLYSVMLGIGESYFALFVLAAGHGKVAAGLVTTVPFLLGALLGLASPRAVRVLRTHKRWIVTCAAVQTLSFVPLAVMGATGHVWLPGVYLAATVYWGSGMAAGSAWNTWIGVLVPRRIRARYFGSRARLCHGGTMLGLVVGGLILESASSGGTRWFGLLFGIAAVCRAISTAYLALQTETGPVPEHHRQVGPRELIKRSRYGRDGRFLLYMMFMQVGVQVAQPYLVPFIRDGMKCSYVDYLLLIAASFGAKAMFQPLWGRFAHRHGALKLLWIGGIGLVPLSGLWMLPIWADGIPATAAFWYLMATQVVSGALWAAYEQAVLLMMFDAIREEERTSLWATFNLGNSAAMVGGSLVGAWLLGESRDLGAYTGAFLLSVALRLATVIFLMRAHELLEPPQPIIIGNAHPAESSIDPPVMVGMTNDRR